MIQSVKGKTVKGSRTVYGCHDPVTVEAKTTAILGKGNWIVIEIAGRIDLNQRSEGVVFDTLKDAYQKGAAYHYAALILASTVSPRSWTHRYLIEMS